MKDHDSGSRDFEVDFEKAQSVKRAHEARLLNKSNVIGVGVGLCMRGGTPTAEVGLVVFVRRKLPASQLEADDVIPSEIDSVPVDVQEIGEIRAGQQPL